MIHCHNLVHEDHDMMVQYAVGDLRINDPITADPPRRDTSPRERLPAGLPAAIPGGDVTRRRWLSLPKPSPQTTSVPRFTMSIHKQVRGAPAPFTGGANPPWTDHEWG